ERRGEDDVRPRRGRTPAAERRPDPARGYAGAPPAPGLAPSPPPAAPDRVPEPRPHAEPAPDDPRRGGAPARAVRPGQPAKPARRRGALAGRGGAGRALPRRLPRADQRRPAPAG